MRDECLNTNIFFSIEDAKKQIEAWRIEYNTLRPHSSLNNLPPVAYAEQFNLGLQNAQKLTPGPLQLTG
jgi:putative transposase